MGHLIDRTLPRTPRRTLWILPAVRVRGSRTLKTTPTSSSADILDPRSGSTHPRPAPATLLVPVRSPHRQWAVKVPCARRRRRGSGRGRRHTSVASSGTHRRTDRRADADDLTAHSLSVCLSVSPAAAEVSGETLKLRRNKRRSFFKRVSLLVFSSRTFNLLLLFVLLLLRASFSSVFFFSSLLLVFSSSLVELFSSSPPQAPEKQTDTHKLTQEPPTGPTHQPTDSCVGQSEGGSGDVYSSDENVATPH